MSSRYLLFGRSCWRGIHSLSSQSPRASVFQLLQLSEKIDYAAVPFVESGATTKMLQVDIMSDEEQIYISKFGAWKKILALNKNLHTNLQSFHQLVTQTLLCVMPKSVCLSLQERSRRGPTGINEGEPVTFSRKSTH